MLNQKFYHVRQVVCFKISLRGWRKEYGANVSAESFNLVSIQSGVKVTHEYRVTMGGKLIIPVIKGVPKTVFSVCVLLGVC